MGSNVSVAIFGANGFIGSRLHTRLKAANFEVHGFSSQDCDLTSLPSLNAAFTQVPPGTAVVMCATINRHVEDSFSALSRNLMMAENMKTAISAFDVSGLVFLSSVDVYGVTPSLPIVETTALHPESYYSIGKLASEEILRLSDGGADGVADGLAVPVSTLRLPGVYGPSDRGNSIVGKFLRRIVKGEEITIYGDGAVLRDYVDVDDVCHIIGELVSRPRNVTLNIAKGESLTLREIIEILANVAGREACLKVLPANGQSAGDLIFDNSALCALCPELDFANLDTGARHYLDQI